MKIYLAGRLAQRPELHQIRQKIWELGHEVVSTWIDEGGDYSTGFGGDQGAKIGMRDMCQIATAELFILDTTSPLSADGGGGREFEFGFAMGQFQHKKCWRVGPKKNSFHALVDIAFESWTDCLQYLGARNVHTQ